MLAPPFQVGLVEAAYQNNLVSMRSEWQSQLAVLQEEVQHKQGAMAYHARSKEVGGGSGLGTRGGGRREAQEAQEVMGNHARSKEVR